MDTIFGIDFGTTNSVLAINQNKHYKIADLDRVAINQKTMRSVLYFNEENNVFIGQEAINKYIEECAQGRFLQSIKSFLPSASFERTFIYGKNYKIDDLVAMIVKKIKKVGEEIVNASVDSVVVGRPSVFSEDPESDKLAEKRLKAAFEKSGFKNIYFQYEPIAAALAYETELKDDQEKIVLVGDFGGGTSDFTVIKLRGGEKNKEDRKSDILAVDGVYIGGDTFDSRIMWDKVAPYFGKNVQYKSMSGDSLGFPSWIINRLCKWHLIPQLKDRRTMEFLKQIKREVDNPVAIQNLENLIQDNYGFMLFQAIEKAKCELSSTDFSEINFPERDLLIKEMLSRQEFERIINEDKQKIEQCIAGTMNMAGLKYGSIDRILLTGGSSKIPYIRKIFIEKFGSNKIVQADEFSSVAYGLAVNGSRFLD